MDLIRIINQEISQKDLSVNYVKTEYLAIEYRKKLPHYPAVPQSYGLRLWHTLNFSIQRRFDSADLFHDFHGIFTQNANHGFFADTTLVINQIRISVLSSSEYAHRGW
jgi:hypothetical protein